MTRAQTNPRTTTIKSGVFSRPQLEAMAGWQFWIDRGGTFTDIVARRPDGTLVTHKLLSENPVHYEDAAIHGIRHLLNVPPGAPLPAEKVECVKMGTTVATNALLELNGEPTVLVTTAGLGDVVRIGTQARPDLFALSIILPPMLYSTVIEVDERIDADGTILVPLDASAAKEALQKVHHDGINSIAIALAHGYRYTRHEECLAELCRDIGFPQISVSHEVSPLMRLVPRASTCVGDAYMSPVLRRYVDTVARELMDVQLLFMQSNGGLTTAAKFRGKDALLSGPAGGVIGMVTTGKEAGMEKLIGFDMGGTSTDVSHYAGVLERAAESSIGGHSIRAPTLDVHTVAAGGGSILHFDGNRMKVGPDSAGSHPGPACYGSDGPLAVTDCNVLLGKLVPDYFPKVFGPDALQPLDVNVVKRKFAEMATQMQEYDGKARSREEIAQGFLDIAVDNMANAIKKISVQRGHDVTAYTLCCFGGAGGQHACLVADRLGIKRVLIHPHAGVLSALGIGLADVRHLGESAVECKLSAECLEDIAPKWAQLAASGSAIVREQGVPNGAIEFVQRLFLRYAGSDTSVEITASNTVQENVQAFERFHKSRFGFVSPEKEIVVVSMQVETIGRSRVLDLVSTGTKHNPEDEIKEVYHPVWMTGKEANTAFIRRETLVPNGELISGPAIVLESTGTTVVEPGWTASVSDIGDLVLERTVPLVKSVAIGTDVDPVQLEIFNNLFMSIAEQMGVVLQNTATSVNIKERLDFSCALFTRTGDLIANAPHIPVHLGSMGAAIKSIIAANPLPSDMKPGRVWMMNAPYNGGTHLPDITVIRPVFSSDRNNNNDNANGNGPVFFVAARGHHADIGGAVPGSCPANSTNVEEEGILIDNFLLVDNYCFKHEETVNLLSSGEYPSRNVAANVGDLQAQVAACEKGAVELEKALGYFGIDTVCSYMQHVQDNGEECVRRAISTLKDSSFRQDMDDGAHIDVSIKIDAEERSADIDFTGTSPVHPGNWNAPSAIATAAVLYVFRLLVGEDIPMNEGCLLPLKIILPENSMVSPRYPAAVVAGNVEVSQVIVDCLLGALGLCGASQGTMNNLIFGNDEFQYYETICGGSGATNEREGASGVQTHMTNSRLTDVEVLEWRFPVVLEEFSLRRGSGGTGRKRGGDGTVRRLRFKEAMEVNVLSGHRRVPPYGMDGGGPGGVGENRKIDRDGTVEEFEGRVTTRVEPGDCFEICSPGGGGYGGM